MVEIQSGNSPNDAMVVAQSGNSPNDGYASESQVPPALESGSAPAAAAGAAGGLNTEESEDIKDVPTIDHSNFQYFPDTQGYGPVGEDREDQS